MPRARCLPSVTCANRAQRWRLRKNDPEIFDIWDGFKKTIPEHLRILPDHEKMIS